MNPGSWWACSAVTSIGTGPQKSPDFCWIWSVRVGAQMNLVDLCLGSFLQVGSRGTGGGDRDESPT